MKYKNIFITAVLFLFCFIMPVGLNYTNIYGDYSRDNHGDHDDHGNTHGRGKTGIRGVVSSVSGSTISVLGMDIDASAAEIVLRDCDSSLSVDDIIEGDMIEGKGNIKDGSFVASIIKIEGAGKLEGIVEAVDNDSITLLGKEIDITSARCIKGKPTVGKKARVYVRNSDSGLTALVVKATGMMGR
ncbi:MAG: hypothetical protein E3K36_10395 [Candidatus Brocadia sp.]|nr:hypothetical protein [Candidatus Brocadia sp.]